MENHFASNLKYLRLQKKLTQNELSKKLGKDYSTIGKWELGQRSPTMYDVVKIANFFSVSLESLINSDFKSNFKNDSDSSFDAFYEMNKHLLTQDDKEHIVFMINKRKKEQEKAK